MIGDLNFFFLFFHVVLLTSILILFLFLIFTVDPNVGLHVAQRVAGPTGVRPGVVVAELIDRQPHARVVADFVLGDEVLRPSSIYESQYMTIPRRSLYIKCMLVESTKNTGNYRL
jgi:hypothetical protein